MKFNRIPPPLSRKQQGDRRPRRPGEKMSATQLLTCQTPHMTKERSELKSTGYEIFIGILSILSIVNLVLAYSAPERRSTPCSSDERAFQCHLPGRLHLPDRHRAIGGRLLLQALRLGRPARQPAVPAAQDPAHLPADPGVPAAPRRRHPHDRPRADQRPRRQLAVRPAAHGHLRAGIRQPHDAPLEQYAPGANITTASDAIWYTIVTISTVGYGDQYPVTGAGRILGPGSSSSASASSAPSPATWPTSSWLPGRRTPHRPSMWPTPVPPQSKNSACARESDAKLTEIRKLLTEPT